MTSISPLHCCCHPQKAGKYIRQTTLSHWTIWAFLEAHSNIFWYLHAQRAVYFTSNSGMLQDSPREPGCNLQCCVIAIMFFSDKTHLMSFRTAKLEQGCLHLRNESKYKQSKPSHHLANHVVYFQEVSYPVHSAIFFSYGWQLPDAISNL